MIPLNRFSSSLALRPRRSGWPQIRRIPREKSPMGLLYAFRTGTAVLINYNLGPSITVDLLPRWKNMRSRSIQCSSDGILQYIIRSWSGREERGSVKEISWFHDDYTSFLTRGLKFLPAMVVANGRLRPYNKKKRKSESQICSGLHHDLLGII